MKRKKFFLIIIITFIILPLLFLMYRAWSIKEKMENCPYLDTSRFGRDIDFYDCFNFYSIEINYEPQKYYRINDDKNAYIIASIKDKSQYKVINGYIYI